MLLRQCIQIGQHAAQRMGAPAHHGTVGHIGPLHRLRNPLSQNGAIDLGLEPVLHPAPQTARFGALRREQGQDAVLRISLFQKLNDRMGVIGHDPSVLSLINQHRTHRIRIKARHLFDWFPGRRHNKFDLQLLLSEDEPYKTAGRV